MASRHELTAAEWARIAPLLPARETSATYYVDHRCVLDDMLYAMAFAEGTVIMRQEADSATDPS